jgi:hypothetical protein
VFEGELYFVGNSNAEEVRLYKIDAEGDVSDVGIVSLSYDYGISIPMVFNGKIYLYRTVINGQDTGVELWSFDGDSWNEIDLPGANFKEGFYSTGFTEFEGKLYFTIPRVDGTWGSILGVMSANGVVTVAPNTDGINTPQSLMVLGSRIIIEADGDSGDELYSYDSVSSPVALDVADGSGNTEHAYPRDMTLLDGKVYFVARDTNYNFDLYASNGLNQPVAISLPVVVGDYADEIPDILNAYKGRLYFSYQGAEGFGTDEVMASTDGTSVRVEPLFGLNPTTERYRTAIFNEKLYFSSSNVYGRELVYFDGTSLTPVTQDEQFNFGAVDDTEDFACLNSTSEDVYFSAEDGITTNLYKYGGNGAPTIVPGGESLELYDIFTIGDTVYVEGEQLDPGEDTDTFLWKYTGSGELQPMTDLANLPNVRNSNVEISSMNGGALFVFYDTLVFEKNDVLTPISEEFMWLDAGVLIGDYYYFESDGPSGYGLYKWNGVGEPTRYSNYLVNDPSEQIYELFTISNRLFAYGSFKNEQDLEVLGFYEVLADRTTLIDPIDLGEVQVDQIISLGNAQYLLIYNRDIGQSELWKVTTTGLSKINSLDSSTVDFEKLLLVNGKITISALLNSGISAFITLDSNDEIESTIETGIDDIDDGMCMTYFEGQKYFYAMDPNYGIELSTIGVGFSADAPGVPIRLAASTTTDKSVRLTWNAPTNNGGHSVSSYLVQYSTNGTTWTNFANRRSTETAVTVSGLKFGTKYYFRVAATSLKGTGSKTSAITKTTMVVRPGKARSLKAVTAKTSATVSWLAPTVVGSATISNYKVETSLDGKKWKVYAHPVSKATKIVLKKLKSKKNYFVRVSAISKAGTGSASSALKFKTK